MYQNQLILYLTGTSCDFKNITEANRRYLKIDPGNNLKTCVESTSCGKIGDEYYYA